MNREYSESCRICGNKSMAVKFEYPEFQIDICGTCDFQQVNRKPTEAEFSQIYSDSYFNHGKYADEDVALRKELERRKNLVEKMGIKKGAKIFDIGCASGEFLDVMAKDYRIWGQDLSQHCIDKVKQRYPEKSDHFQHGFVEDLDFASNTFDLITMWDVIEHLWDPIGVLRLVSYWLKPGGKIIVSTPDTGAMTAQLLGKRWAFMTPPEHLSFFGHSTIRRAFSERGFSNAFCFSRGKFVNIAFLFYKLNRVMPVVFPAALVNIIQSTMLAKKVIYIPTSDILYAGFEKNN